MRTKVGHGTLSNRIDQGESQMSNDAVVGMVIAIPYRAGNIF